VDGEGGDLLREMGWGEGIWVEGGEDPSSYMSGGI